MKYKKIINLTISIGIILSNIGTIAATNDNFTPKNKYGYQEFLELKENTTSSQKKLKSSETKLEQIVDNQDINSLKSYSFQDSNESQISYSNDTGYYIYTESQDEDNSLLMIIDDEKYRIISKGENIYIVSEEGKAEIISEMIYNNDNSIKNYSNIEEFSDTTSNINTYAYGKDYGPFYKTNKSLCKVLSVISITTKLFKWSHPALGTISFVCSTVSKVGDTFLKTMYIKFYQTFDTEKPNNVKETQHWYFDSNYQNLAKTKTIKFSNTKLS